jgi:uncharacterized protein
MIIDSHTHLYCKGWLPRKFFHGVARFITTEFAKHGVVQSNEEVGDSLMDSTHDPDAAMLLAEMDDAGIDTSVVFTVDFGLELGEPEVPIREVNRSMSEIVRRYPDRLIAFASVDPRRPDALEIFTACIEQWGMKGLKLHPSAGFYPNQKEVYPLLEKACHYGVPVIIHSGAMMLPLRSKYSQAIYFDDLAVDFPDLAIVAAHAGGILSYRQMLSIAAVKLNLLVDISAWQIIAIKNYRLFCEALREMIDFSGPDRILFGSDSLRAIMANSDWVELIKKLPENAGASGVSFTQEEISAILGGNAQRLLNMEGRPAA